MLRGLRIWEQGSKAKDHGLHELIFVLVCQGLCNGDGLKDIDQADNDSQLELVAKVVHCRQKALRSDKTASSKLLRYYQPVSACPPSLRQMDSAE